MNVSLLIVTAITIGMGLAWALHIRSVRRMTPVLNRLAAETNGVVNSRIPFVMPKLRFSYSGVDVEISSASTGLDGQSIRYRYVLFKGLEPTDFKFRILPRSVPTLKEERSGTKRPMAAEPGTLGQQLTINASNDRLMNSLLTDCTKADLLFWADRKRKDRISDIRNYEDKLIYAVTGEMDNYEDSRMLLDSACRFFDVFNSVVSGSGRASNNQREN